jgi:hypothetical protein
LSTINITLLDNSDSGSGKQSSAACACRNHQQRFRFLSSAFLSVDSALDFVSADEAIDPRFLINYNELQIGAKIGDGECGMTMQHRNKSQLSIALMLWTHAGLAGVVYSAMWRHTAVAVKEVEVMRKPLSARRSYNLMSERSGDS